MLMMQIFQKGSPIAKDFSKAIVELLENGEIKRLQNELLTPKKDCSKNTRPESLHLNSFLGLYIICGATSTLCFILSLIIWVKKFKQQEGNAGPSDESFWKKMVRLARFYKGLDILGKAPSFTDWCSQIRCEYSTASNTPESLQAFTPGEIECVTQR